MIRAAIIVLIVLHMADRIAAGLMAAQYGVLP